MALCRQHGIVVTDTSVTLNGTDWLGGDTGNVTPRHGDVTGVVTPRHGDDTGNQNQNQNQYIPPNPPAGGANGGLAIATALAGSFPEHRRTRLVDVADAVADAIARGDVTAEELLARSEEHTSELQSPCNLVCRLLLEKKKTL